MLFNIIKRTLLFLIYNFSVSQTFSPLFYTEPNPYQNRNMLKHYQKYICVLLNTVSFSSDVNTVLSLVNYVGFE